MSESPRPRRVEGWRGAFLPQHAPCPSHLCLEAVNATCHMLPRGAEDWGMLLGLDNSEIEGGEVRGRGEIQQPGGFA